MPTQSFRAYLFERAGGLEVIKEHRLELGDPGPGEVLVGIQACGLGFTDVMMRKGVYPDAPPFPFVPGYEIAGEVLAVGPGVRDFRKGDRVCALTMVGGCAEGILLPESELVRIPDGVDAQDVAATVLNYVTAWQMMHRIACVPKGAKVLIHAAAGGVGSALMDLGRAHGLDMYGTGSEKNGDYLASHGCKLIDYEKVDFADPQRPGAIADFDAIFDALGGTYVKKSFSCLAPTGHLVEYGLSSAVSGGRGRLLAFATAARGFFDIWRLGLFAGGRKVTFFGVTHRKKSHPQDFRADLENLLESLRDGRIKPNVQAVFSFEEFPRAHALLDSRKVQGKLVLSCARST